MKELELEFTGKGQVRGFKFTQLKKNKKAYLYRVDTGHLIMYEVFHRKENTRFNCISYPSNKAFGIWAWTYKNLYSAEEIFKLITEMEVDNG